MFVSLSGSHGSLIMRPAGILSGGQGILVWLDFASDGFFYGVDTVGDVFRVDPTSAAVTPVGNNGLFMLSLAAQRGPATAPELGILPISLALAVLSVAAGMRIRRKRRPTPGTMALTPAE